MPLASDGGQQVPSRAVDVKQVSITALGRPRATWRVDTKTARRFGGSSGREPLDSGAPGFYQRMLAPGNPKKASQIASVHKLLNIPNDVLCYSYYGWLEMHGADELLPCSRSIRIETGQGYNGVGNGSGPAGLQAAFVLKLLAQHVQLLFGVLQQRHHPAVAVPVVVFDLCHRFIDVILVFV